MEETFTKQQVMPRAIFCRILCFQSTKAEISLLASSRPTLVTYLTETPTYLLKRFHRVTRVGCIVLWGIQK